MPKRNRPSQLKREREQKKRQRQRDKAEKAAVKRERRFNQNDDGEAIPPDPHAEATDIEEGATIEPTES
jgi:hypothetical protein